MRALSILFLGCLLCWQIGDAKIVFAQNSRGTDKSSDSREAEESQVFLRFVAKTWDDVLESVGKQSGMEVVIPEIPRGRFTRYEHKGLPLEAALRILNHELKATGYQILHKGNYLIVLRNDRLRPEYDRNEYSPASATSTTSEKPNVQQKTTNKKADLIQQANWKSKVDNQAEVSTEASNEANRPKSAASPRPKLQALAIEPGKQDAITISRHIYQAYGKHAKLIQQGPLGLPAFEVQIPRPASEDQMKFTIGIDQQQNQMILVADEQLQSPVLSLLEHLDQEATTGKNLPELLLIDQQLASPFTEQLPQILAQVRENNQNSEATDNSTKPSTMTNQEENIVAEDSNTETKVPPQLNDILDRLRGDVSIESLNDLGLLILRGNESDVDGVMQIIQAIESMSAGITPEIHLRHLEYVNSEALASLLNSVYESVQGIDSRANKANRRVSVTAVVQPNSLLIVAPATDLESALELIDELDQPMQPNREVVIFRLKNTTAGQAVTLLQEFYEDRGGLGTRIRVTADNRTNSLIVQASPKDLQEIRLVIKDLDQDHSHAISQIQLFPLKNAVADELAEFINSALDEALSPRNITQAAGGQNSNQNEQKSFVLEFLAGSGSQQELIRSGILADIRISADPRTNSLAVIAPDKSLPLIAALIDALDKPADAVAEVKVFTLTHADANAALVLLQDLFNQSDSDSPVGVNLAGTADAGSVLLPIRFSVDTRSNSILAIGGMDALTVVEAILLRLDNEAPDKRITTVLRLKNSPAADVAEAINSFLESQRELAEIDPELVSAVEQVDREVIIVPETLSNNLLISATPEYYGEVLRIAQQLDAAPAQVIIQALLVEVELDNLDELGIELGFQDSILFNRSIIDNIQTVTNTVTNQNIQTTTQQIVSQEGAPGFLFNNPTLFPNLGNNTGPVANPNAVGGQGLSNFGVGRVSGDLGYGGLVLSASSESVSILLRALAQQRNVQVLSRPQIRTVDSQLAEIQVGQRVPIVNGVNITTQGVANPNIEYDEAGIILSVTPRINPDGQIVMEVIAERSAYRDDGVEIFVDASTGNTITSPVKDISVARATVGVSDGQTIVLGGMITETDTAITRKVPWLGDVPVLGRLFRYDSASNVRNELLIFLTPRILNQDYDNETIKEIEASRIHFFREEAEEIHGPLFGVPVQQQLLLNPDMLEETPFTFEEGPIPLESTIPSIIPETNSAKIPLSPPEIPDDEQVPRTLVPDGSLKPMQFETENSPAKQNGQLQESPGVSRL